MKKKFQKLSSLLFIFIFSSLIAFAGEGMWLPFLLKKLNEKDMKAMGMKISAEDIYSVNKGSLKDAIVHFGGGCTGEVISDQGLLLTNHHCGHSYIQSHSTMENNYLQNGFWARNKQEELACPGLFVTFISKMEDVTTQVMRGTTAAMTEAERQSAIDKNINDIKAAYPLGKQEEVTVKPFFDGNQYILIVTVNYTDIRMVGAPPSSIGSFGADTDNWVWPRHSADFSIFRIYAGKDNMPAAYSPDNVPFKPKHFLPISMDGVKEGDFTMVFGFPGRTSEYLSSFAVQQVADVLDPARIAIRDRALKIQDAAMRANPEVKIQYASKYARIANYWKKWQGEVLGLKKSKAVKKKQDYEKEFGKRVAANKQWSADYGRILPDLEMLHQKIEPYAKAREIYIEVALRNSEILGMVNQLPALESTLSNNGEAAFLQKKSEMWNKLKGFYKNYRVEIDRKVFEELIRYYFENLDAQFVPDYLREEVRAAGKDFGVLTGKMFDKSIFTDAAKMEALFAESPENILTAFKKEPLYQLSTALSANYKSAIVPFYEELNTQIEKLQRTYMKAQMEVFSEKTFYPDANSTLRLTYGKVQGYQPRDAISYHFQTYLDGVMEKYVPGDYEFDVPAKLIKLYEKKDYGRYGENGKMPVCFIGSNHTTGGNSGSPAIDASGNLIGLNFDRVWEGTMSDINYDPSICRNIMVDIRYILFLIDKFAGAGHLVDEMKLVHPKSGAVKNTIKKSH